jgi:virginiamycin A acetyltransferase
MPFPSTTERHPLVLPDGNRHEGTVFLKAVLKHARIEVGDYSYANDFDPPQDWAARIAPYLYEHSAERLVIGRFCQIANGVRFITASANHRYDGISSYPFAIFDGFGERRPSLPSTFRDTMVGNDVWFGDGAQVMPGAWIGSGVIVGAGSVVSGRVPDYTIVAGNPARVVRHRFSPDEVEALLELAWWNWPIEHILAHEVEICSGDVAALARVRPKS